MSPKVYWLKTAGGEVSKCKGYPGKRSKDQIVRAIPRKIVNLRDTEMVSGFRDGSSENPQRGSLCSYGFVK